MAEIQSNIAFMSDISIPIEVDDILERTRGTITNRFLVTNVDVNDGLEPYSLLEPGIEVKIKPLRKQRSADKTLNIHSITADRVYINSTDNSTNISILSAEDNAKFNELKTTVTFLSNNNEQLIQQVEDMRSSVGKPSFKRKVNNFIANAANHITVYQGIASFIGWLSSLS